MAGGCFDGQPPHRRCLLEFYSTPLLVYPSRILLKGVRWVLSTYIRGLGVRRGAALLGVTRRVTHRCCEGDKASE